MKKLSKKQKLIVFIAILIVTVIVDIIITTSIVRNNEQVANEGYAATSANAGSSLISNYILNGITIGGITGTLETIDTSDATATAEDITEGKTAYVKGEKITGTNSASGPLTEVSKETKSLTTGGSYTFENDYKAVFIRAYYTGYNGSSLGATVNKGDFTVEGQESHFVNASFGTWGYAHRLIYGISPKAGDQITFSLGGTTNSNLTLDIYLFN